VDFIEGMQSAIDNIEGHLPGPVAFDDVARAAGCSTFHFMRLFNILTELTLGEYIRNRRLTLAGQELSLSRVKVLDIALKYGYETHESFTKAFRAFHGIPPSAARRPGASLKSVGRLSIQVILKGDKALNYKLIEREAFTVVGKKTEVTCQNGENFRIIPEFCKRCNEDGTCAALEKMVGDELGVMGICDVMHGDCFDYYMAVTHNGGEVPSGMAALAVPKSTWAVFEAVGPIPGAIQDVWKRIFSQWFPASSYEHAPGPELEVYGLGDMAAPDYRCWVWIPVVKKSR
jgi:AraC family transcriptional regulator